MERPVIFSFAGIILLITGLAIIFALFPPDLTQLYLLLAVVLIIIGICIIAAGGVTSVSKPSKGKII